MNIPSISSYGRYESDNYGVNTLQVSFGSMTLYYSYRTIVAYCDFDDGLVCSKNYWTVTTGKHLNWIQPDKKARVESEKFESMLQAALARHIS